MIFFSSYLFYTDSKEDLVSQIFIMKTLADVHLWYNFYYTWYQVTNQTYFCERTLEAFIWQLVGQKKKK